MVNLSDLVGFALTLTTRYKNSRQEGGGGGGVLLPEKLGGNKRKWGLLVGMCGPHPKTLTLFMTKICEIPYPIYDLTKNSKPYLWP